MSSQHPESQEHQPRHPTFKQYVMIATILFVITIVEFMIIFPQNLRGTSIVVAPLIILSAIKFAIVVMFYMHLKFDSRLFTGVFIGGLGLGLAVVLAVLGLFGSFQPTPRDFAEANATAFEHGAEDGPHPPAEPPRPPAAPPPGEPSGPPEAPPADTGGPGELAAQGRSIFTGKGGCAACHTIEGVSSGLVGPDLTHIGTDGANRKPGTSAREYIRESIREPEAFIASGVERANPGLMTSAITASLSDAEVEALVEFLLAQK
jgi:cytochrome c oxidase subunit 4